MYKASVEIVGKSQEKEDKVKINHVISTSVHFSSDRYIYFKFSTLFSFSE